MSTQLAHVYNVNRNAPNPVNVICTPLNGKLLERLTNVGRGVHLRWKGIQMLDKKLEDLWTASAHLAQSEVSSSTSTPLEHAPIPATNLDTLSIEKANVIYLTADSPHSLSKVEEGKTYVIGGLVDHNRYKVAAYIRTSCAIKAKVSYRIFAYPMLRD